jgi:hypothetical protein
MQAVRNGGAMFHLSGNGRGHSACPSTSSVEFGYRPPTIIATVSLIEHARRW